MGKKIIIKNIDVIYTMSKEGVQTNASIIIEDGKIKKISSRIEDKNNNMEVIDGSSLIALPGLIDPCTHIGVYPLEWEYGEHGVEKSDPITPHLTVIDGLDLFDKAFDDAVRGGITTIGVHPGSYMSFGPILEHMTIVPGQVAVLKTNRKILFENHGIVFALGEHVKRYLKEQKLSPTTRMGMVAAIRALFNNAIDYKKKKASEEKVPSDPKLEAIVKLLEDKLVAYIHAHTSRDIRTLIGLLNEYGVKRKILVHGTEAYMVSDLLKKYNIPVILGPIVFSKRGVELRNLDSNIPLLLYDKGILFSLTTDHPTIPIQYLSLMASVAVGEGLPREEALKAITINAARILGLDANLGSLEPGKDADIVLFDGDPLDPQSKVVYTIIDGEIVYSR